MIESQKNYENSVKNCDLLNCNVIEYNKNLYLTKTKIFNTLYKNYLELLIKEESESK